MWNSSFYDYLVSEHPGLLPQKELNNSEVSSVNREMLKNVPHGTTVLALKYKDGVIIAGDRRATEGYQISARRVEKVYRCDDYSAIAISGAAGACIEMAKLLQVELEHYEKLEGVTLTTEGKANKLSQMIKANLPLAMQGLIVIPIFAGYDLNKQEGRIYKYDVTGGRYEETDYYATGSGGKDARSTLKKFFSPGMTEDKGIQLALESLYDAAEEDVGTAGPDLVRGIYPTVKVIKKTGIEDVDSVTIETVYKRLIGDKQKSAKKER
ncbi:MAG: proteasome subunit beta [Nitrospirae bacterium]|nr:proteasome subunit beta [Nitrospirota bacterium]